MDDGRKRAEQEIEELDCQAAGHQEKANQKANIKK